MIPALLAAEGIDGLWVPLAVAGMMLVFVTMSYMMAKRYARVGPNEALVIWGRKTMTPAGPVGFRIVKGGGSFVFPVIEKCARLSLEIMTININLPEVRTVTGVAIPIAGTAQVKIKGDDAAIAAAAERFLSLDRVGVKEVLGQLLESHLRTVVGAVTVKELCEQRDVFVRRVTDVVTSDFESMGLALVSFTLRDLRDNQVHGR